MAIIVDTGVLYALSDEDDAWHERSVEWIDGVSELLIVPVSVLPEVAYLLHTRLGARAELTFMQSIAAGELELEDLRRADLARCCEVMRRYPDIGLVDASIVTIAERLKAGAIATTDHRHFGKIVPKHIPSFTLLP